MKYNELFDKPPAPGQTVPPSYQFSSFFQTMMQIPKPMYDVSADIPGHQRIESIISKLQDVYRIERNEALDVWDAVVATLAKRLVAHGKEKQASNLLTWKKKRFITQPAVDSLDTALDAHQGVVDADIAARVMRMAYNQLLKAGIRAIK